MRRTSFETMNCPIARSLEVIGDWWTLLIVREAFRGAQRFGEFQSALGLSTNVLSSRLKSLVEAGILEVAARDQGGRAVAYEMTGKGRALLPTLVTLSLWGLEHQFEGEAPPLELFDSVSGTTVTGVLAQTEDQQVIELGRVWFRQAKAG